MKTQSPKKKKQKPNKHYFDYWQIINNTLLFLFFILLPTQFGKHFFLPFSFLSGVRVDYLAPTVYLTDIFIFILLIINLKSIFQFLKNRYILLILALLLVNVIFSRSLNLSFYRLIKYLEVFVIVGVVIKSKLSFKWIMNGFLVSGLFELVLAAAQFVSKQSLQGIYYFFGERLFALSTPGIAKTAINGIEFIRPYATFSHPNSMAGFFLLVYFIIMSHSSFNRFWLQKILLLFICSLLIFLSFSKTAMAVFVILNIGFLLFKNKQPCKICSLAKLSALIVLAFIVFMAKGDSLSMQKRIDLIKNSIAIFLSNPFTGTGAGTYLLAQSEFDSKLLFVFNQPVHNIFLLMLSELGIVILLPILLIFINIWKEHRNTVLSTVLLTIALTGLFDHYWLTLQQNLLLIGVAVGLSKRV